MTQHHCFEQQEHFEKNHKNFPQLSDNHSVRTKTSFWNFPQDLELVELELLDWTLTSSSLSSSEFSQPFLSPTIYHLGESQEVGDRTGEANSDEVYVQDPFHFQLSQHKQGCFRPSDG